MNRKLLRDVREGSFGAWQSLQNYKRYFWAGGFAARLWLLFRYGWNDWRDSRVGRNLYGRE